MSMLATDTATIVASSVLSDGIVVRLSGSLDVSSLVDLRATLLSPRPAGCADVLVDAGQVTEVHERALALLVAASDWADQTGGQLRFVALSEPLIKAAEYFGVQDLLPMLPAPGRRTATAERHIGGRVR